MKLDYDDVPWQKTLQGECHYMIEGSFILCPHPLCGNTDQRGVGTRNPALVTCEKCLDAIRTKADTLEQLA